jgi:YVTN family beta-propeller protein
MFRRPTSASKATTSIVAVLVAGVSGCSFVLQRAEPAPSPTPAGGIVATIPLSTTPGSPVVGAGSVWVPNMADGTLSRVDPQSNRVVSTIGVGDPGRLLAAGCGASSVHAVPPGSYDVRRCDIPSGVAVGGGSAWVTRNDAVAISDVDLATNELRPPIPIGVEAWGIAASPDAVWVSDFEDDAIVHVDPFSRSVVATLRGLAHGPTGVAIGVGGVWVANSRAASVTRIDPVSNTVTAVIPVQAWPLSIAIGFGSVWVRNDRANSVSRIDPISNTVVATIPVRAKEGRDGVDSMGVDATGIWVSGLAIVHVNARTNAVDMVLPQDGVAVDFGAGSLWVTRLLGDVVRVAV